MVHRWVRVRVLVLSLCALFPGCGDDGGAPDGGAGAGGAQAGQNSMGGGSGAGVGGAGQSSGGAAGSGAAGSSGGSPVAGAPGDGPNVDSTLTLRALTPEQKAVVCDWVYGKLGGYGATTTCVDGTTLKNLDTQELCVSAGLRFACAIATVGDLARCTTAQVPSRGCLRPDPECNGLYCR